MLVCFFELDYRVSRSSPVNGLNQKYGASACWVAISQAPIFSDALLIGGSFTLSKVQIYVSCMLFVHYSTIDSGVTADQRNPWHDTRAP